MVSRKNDCGMHITRAIAKYGEESFTRTILEECDETILNDREIFWINKLNTFHEGYNLTTGGDGGIPGYKFSNESREKIRKKAIGRKHNEETKQKMRSAAQKRPKPSKETIEKRAQANRGKKRTPEQKRNISVGQLTSNYKHSEETRKKISKAGKGHVTSEEIKEKLRKSSSKIRHTDEAKVRISKARSKPIEQRDSETFEVIEVFPSLKVAAEKTKVGYCTIQRGIYEKRIARGFRWTYKREV